MNQIQIRHVKDALRQNFTDHIDMSDVAARGESDRDQLFLPRALAALALQELTGQDAAQSAAGVIDGYDDHGIDAIAVRPTSPHVWVVQSKWSDRGKASLDLNAALKLRRGISFLMNGEYQKFNLRLQKIVDDVDAVLGTPGVKFTVIVALMGQHDLSPEVKVELERMCDEFNEVDSMFDLVLREVSCLAVGGVGRSTGGESCCSGVGVA